MKKKNRKQKKEYLPEPEREIFDTDSFFMNCMIPIFYFSRVKEIYRI